MKTGKIFIAVALSLIAAILISALVVIGASAYGTALLSDYYGSDYFYGSIGMVPEYRSGDYSYILNGNEATLTDYRGNIKGELKIPSLIDGYKVTVIDSYLFSRCDFTSVIIPDSVTKIEYCAFYCCESLETVVLGDGLKTLGNNVFGYCRNLKRVTFGSNLESIWNYAFDECYSLERVDIPDILSWCGIDFYSYYSNPLWYGAKLYINGALAKEIIIPDSVTYINDYAFGNCTSITKLTLGDNVTSIGDSAFSGCSNIADITFPQSLITIGDYAFEDCTAITKLILGDNVTSIGYRAFADCSNITNITLPKSLINIGNYAFENCNALLNVYYKGNVGDWCNIEFGSDDWNWQASANPLCYASALYINGIKATDISIPSGVTKINDYAFYNCESITSVYIPNSVTTIGNGAFEQCDNLSSISMNGVTEIGDGAFAGCSSISKLKIGNKLQKIGGSAFSGCSSIKSIVLPETVSDIGAYAFGYCYNLASINIPYGIKKIENSTFYGCYRLENVVLPETVTEIGGNAFNYCGDSYYQFATVTIPNSVKIIAYDAFGTEAYEYNGIIINCPQGSYADEFAQNRGIKVSYYNKVVKIEVVKNPEQTVYAVGSGLITTGLKLNITTDDGNTKIITDGYEIGEYDFSIAGVKEIVVSYSGCQTSFKVMVDASLQPYPQSEHPYADNSDISWKYYHPSDVSALVISFSTETAVEGGCDFIYIYDAKGVLVGEYTGNELAGKSVTVNGSFFKIRLVSDESFSKYGFSIISVVPKANGIKEGDVNGDGVLNASDLTLMRKAIIEGVSADMNGDGSTDVRDLVCLKKALTIA